MARYLGCIVVDAEIICEMKNPRTLRGEILLYLTFRDEAGWVICDGSTMLVELVD